MSIHRTVSAGELHERLNEGERLQVVDVRSVQEFDSGHVPGAINIPIEILGSRLGDLDLNAPTVLVCQSGNRATMACGAVGHRFSNLEVLDGGTQRWIAQNLEVVRSTKSGMSLLSQSLLGAGLVNLLGVTLALFVNPAWLGLSAFVSIGLMVAGSTGFCLMATILAKMPWNGPRPKLEGAQSGGR